MPYVRRASHRLEGNHEPILHTSSAAGGAVRPAGGAAGCGDCLFCIAFSALDAVQTQRAAVSGQYTTVGIPKLDIDCRKVLFTRDGGFTALSQQDTTYPGLITEDRRVFMTAHVPGSQAVSAYERGFFFRTCCCLRRVCQVSICTGCAVHRFLRSMLRGQSIDYRRGHKRDHLYDLSAANVLFHLYH